MVLHNPNNWHWVNKDVSEWARAWLQENLSKIDSENDGVAAKITNVTSMDGDVDVSQRKGKVITLFDVKLQLEYEGMAKDSFVSGGADDLKATPKKTRMCKGPSRSPRSPTILKKTSMLYVLC